MRKTIPLLLIVAATAAGGCASMRKVLPERSPKAEADEVEQMRQELVELRRRATVTEVEVERLRRQLAELLAEQRPAAPIREAVADARPSRPAADTAPRGDLSQPVVIEELDLEVSDLAPGPAVAGAEQGVQSNSLSSRPVATANPPAAGSPLLTEAGQAQYDQGYTLFHRGQYLDAETVFQQFLAGYGDTDLGDNAQFWIGEARYARQDLSGAMAAFREVVRRYPEGNKVPDALLKVADCQRGLGDIDGARKTYEEVANRFPFAAAAAVAEDRLNELP